MALHVLVIAVPGIPVDQPCKVLLPSRLAVYHLVNRCVKLNIQDSVQMEQAVPITNVQVALFRLQIGPVYSTWLTGAI
jgi:hypothetical protein